MAEKLELFLSAQEPLSLEAFQTTIANGKDGITFVPHINNEGILSWTNDGGLQNPSPLKIKGEDGANGKDGAPGKDGTNGKDGAPGKDGKPFTYDDFTEAQLAALKGKDGKDGTNGKDGINGKDGTNGKDGVSPVRGIDYWTDADIATIKSYVDNAILGGAW